MVRMKFEKLCRRVCLFLILGVSGAGGNYQPLLDYLPESANVLMLIDMSALYHSEMGARENIKVRHEMAYEDQPILLPPTTRRAVIAGDMDLNQLGFVWAVSVIELREPIKMDQLVLREDGLLDTLGGKKSILSPLNAYFVEFEKKIIATIYPARRQFACRWINSREDKKVLSPYLQKAVGYSRIKGNDIVLAMDLKDVPTPHKIARRLETSKVLTSMEIKPKVLTKLLSSIEGVTLVIEIDKKATGKIIMHFGENTWIMKDYAKDLFLEILSETGAWVEDFDDWEVSVIEKIVTLEGDLTMESLRRLLSLFEIPTPTSRQTAEPTDSQSSGKVADASQGIAEKSQKYFQTIKRYVEDLRMQAKGKSGHKILVWMEKYAVKIENLPILDIDEDLQVYGANVAYYLRDSSDQLRSSNRSSQAKQAQYHQGRSASRYGRYGGVYGSRSDNYYLAGERKRVAFEEQEKGFGKAIDVFRLIDAETAQIRRLMTQRYHVEF